MSRLSEYHARLLRDMDQHAPYVFTDKLNSLWPTLIGGVLFAAFDLLIGLPDDGRIVVLSICFAPGVLWLAYLAFREMQAFRRWYSRTSASGERNANG